MALTYVGDANAKKDGKEKGQKSKEKGRSTPRRESKQQQARNVPINRSRNLTLRNRPSGRIEPMGRSSLRSKGSSSNSSDKQGRMKKFKSCCRKTVEFMFTQVIIQTTS